MECDVPLNVSGKKPSKNDKLQTLLSQTFSFLFAEQNKNVSSNFSIHLHTLRLQQVPLGKSSYGSHTAFTSMDWSTQVGYTSHHATHHEDYSTGVATEQHRKGAAASECSQSCQGSPLKNEMPTVKHLE